MSLSDLSFNRRWFIPAVRAAELSGRSDFTAAKDNTTIAPGPIREAPAEAFIN